MSAKLAHAPFAVSVLACMAILFLWPVCCHAEGQKEWTRADLIAALERGPGPSKGLADAPVVMVYFTDFQCGYCRKFVLETLPQLETQYIRPGKVRLVYRHLAILGEASVRAARASSCAFDQGRFWEYHNALFASRSPVAFTAARLKRYAADLRLDEKGFSDCLENTAHAKQVEAETLIARALGANGTPAFLINGQLVLGAYPFEVFQQGLDNLISSLPRKVPGQTRP